MSKYYVNVEDIYFLTSELMWPKYSCQVIILSVFVSKKLQFFGKIWNRSCFFFRWEWKWFVIAVGSVLWPPELFEIRNVNRLFNSVIYVKSWQCFVCGTRVERWRKFYRTQCCVSSVLFFESRKLSFEQLQPIFGSKNEFINIPWC